VEFKAAIQGHYAILDEENSERRRSLTASRHYSDYEIADSVIARYNGRRKGVRLGEDGVPVISPFRERSSEQPKPHRKKHFSSVRIWRDDKPLLDSLFERLGLDATLNQSQKMAHLLLWVNRRLADSPQPLQGEFDLSLIPSEDQAISSPDPQEATASTAQVFLQPDDEPDPEPPDKISSPPVEEAPTPSGLEEKLERLIDVMAQFLSLQMAQATAPKPSPPKKSPPPKDAPAPPSEAAIKEAAIANKEAAVSESAPTAIANDDKPSRSPRHSPEAEAAINNAIDALIAHNNKTELHDLKWFISQLVAGF
jgi:hypothetical protein